MNVRAAGLAAATVMMMLVAIEPGATARAAAGRPPGAVTAAGITAATTTSLTLQWTDPSGGGFSGVVIRRAQGSKAPGFATGTLVATTGKTVTSFTDRNLAPGTRYSYALFARGAGGSHASVDAVTGVTNPPLKIATAVLPRGTAGMTYRAALAASGGTPPYTWRAAGLPGGLSVATDGVISGFPAAVGTRKVTVTVTDAGRATRTAVLTLAVPGALPAGCAARACAQLSPDGQTVAVPAADIRAVTRDPASNAVTQVVLTGLSVGSGDVLVLAPASGVPSGLIAVAGIITANGDGSVTVAVTPARPSDAYDSGTVQALPGKPAAGTLTMPERTAAAQRAAAAALKCSGGVSADLRGMSVTHTLTPSLAAIWKHPYFGGGGIYIGSGGLSLFQFDLNGTISLNMGVTVSGAATCTLTLPEMTADVPAGNLGTVIFTTQPKLSFAVTGKIDVRDTLTLSCGAEYRWDNGTQSRDAYCVPGNSPLRLSADSGLNATLTGYLDTTVTLDNIAGITGDLWAQLHAGYQPAAHPIAELDASAGWDLGACLLCFWPDSPAHVTIGSGTFFTRTLATYDTTPPLTPPVITTTTFPRATAGTSYSAQLTTADHRPGTWHVTAGKLPPGLSPSGHAISGTPTTAGTYSFTLSFTDTHDQVATARATLVVAHSSWANAAVPLPANAANPGQAGLSGVSCPSASFCAAAGFYEDASSRGDGLLLTRSGGTWKAAQAPLPAGATGATLSAVSCPSASFCAAAGHYIDASPAQDPLLVTWSGGSWTLAHAPLPADTAAHAYASLSAVSCASASFCVAVGYYADASGSTAPLLLTWSGGSWTATRAPLPADSASPASAGLHAVACPSASFCVAGGTYTAGDSASLLLTWSGGSWTADQPFTGYQGEVNGLSCPSVSFCKAVGDYLVPDGRGAWDYQPEVLTWSGVWWTTALGPIPAGATEVALFSGSCPSASFCVALGNVNDEIGYRAWQAMLFTWSGGSWTATPSPDQPDLNSVSCSSAWNCVVVGGTPEGNPILLTSSG